MVKGWICLYRDIQDHWIWEDSKYLKWWITILMNVNHEEKKFPVGDQIFLCNSGQSFRSIEKWTELFHCSKKTTIKFFDMLKKDNMILAETIGSGNRRKHLLTVCNWGKYQTKETENSTERVPECSANGNPNVPSNNNEEQLINNENNVIGVKSKRFTPPSIEDVKSYCLERKNRVDPEEFIDFYQSKNWMVGKNKMKDWEASVRTWEKRGKEQASKNKNPALFYQQSSIDDGRF